MGLGIKRFQQNDLSFSLRLTWMMMVLMLIMAFMMPAKAAAENVCGASLTSPPYDPTQFLSTANEAWRQAYQAQDKKTLDHFYPHYKQAWLHLMAQALARPAAELPGLTVHEGGSPDDPYLTVVVQRSHHNQDFYQLTKDDGDGPSFRYTHWVNDRENQIIVSTEGEELRFATDQQTNPFLANVLRAPVVPYYGPRPIPEFNLAIRGPSIYAVREEVRKLAENLRLGLQEKVAPDTDEYVLFAEVPSAVYRWELKIKILHDSRQQVAGAQIGMHRYPLKREAGTAVLHFGDHLFKSWEEVPAWYGHYLGDFLAHLLAMRPGDIFGSELAKLGLAFKRYRQLSEHYTWGIVRRRPVTVEHGQDQEVYPYWAPLSTKREIKELFSEIVPRKFFNLIPRQDQWAVVASRILDRYRGRYTLIGPSDHPAQFLGAVHQVDGHVKYYQIRDFGQGLPSRLFEFSSRLGFVDELREILHVNPVIYVGQQMREEGSEHNMRSIQEKRTYTANLPYPSRKTLALLRETVLKFAQEKGLDLQELSEPHDARQFKFELVLPNQHTGWNNFREHFTINYFAGEAGPNPRLNYEITRQLVYDNHYTDEKNVVLDIPIQSYEVGDQHDLYSFDGVFEEVSQILGDYIQAAED